MILDKLNYPVTALKGIGAKTSKLLNRIDIFTISDLLQYFPRTFSDRTKTLLLNQACMTDQATVKAAVTAHRMIGKKYRKFLKVLIHDGVNYGALLCFNRNFLKSALVIGKEYYITGRFTFNYGEIQSSSFEFEEATDEPRPRIVPVYRLTKGLTQNVLRKAAEDAVNTYYPDIEDELPEHMLIRRRLMKKNDAVKNAHFPSDFSAFAGAKRTFIYEEFFYQRFFLLKRKESLQKIKKHRPAIDYKLKTSISAQLPFALTDYQTDALDEIEKDLFSGHITSRLLQGDVGSGKTVVALLSMISVAEAGYQCALMAPTEVLALQHYRTIKEFTGGLDLNIALFTGSLSKKERDNILDGLRSGVLQMVIGTHSLFGEDVIYKNLGYVVIDEQQRFGVEQRYQLAKKGSEVDLLLMTATPIPRSLAMTLYGDLEVTLMKGLIRGRKPVKTWLIDNKPERIQKMHDWVLKTLKDTGGRAIFVYSLIEGTENSEEKDLNGQYEILSGIYKDFGAGFIHSKIKSDEKETIMNDFAQGRIKVLAATTVVEVGIDVPDANIIVVEDAENYGLSTLHQLRGRVGRNDRQAYMILAASSERLTETGRKRLEIMTKEHDGFKIAEEDLMLRGPGDFIGSRQSGLPEYKFADIRSDLEIMKEASEDAESVFADDKELELPANSNMRLSFLQRLNTYTAHYRKAEP